jgi:hypothetical protein
MQEEQNDLDRDNKFAGEEKEDEEKSEKLDDYKNEKNDF